MEDQVAGLPQVAALGRHRRGAAGVVTLHPVPGLTQMLCRDGNRVRGHVGLRVPYRDGDLSVLGQA